MRLLELALLGPRNAESYYSSDPARDQTTDETTPEIVTEARALLADVDPAAPISMADVKTRLQRADSPAISVKAESSILLNAFVYQCWPGARPKRARSGGTRTRLWYGIGGTDF